MCLEAVVEELRSLDGRGMADAELAAHLLDVQRVVDAAAAAQLRVVGRFETRKLHKVDGAWSTGAWLRERTDLSRSEANALERHARAIRSDPLLSEALDTMGAAKVRAVLRHVVFASDDVIPLKSLL